MCSPFEEFTPTLILSFDRRPYHNLRPTAEKKHLLTDAYQLSTSRQRPQVDGSISQNPRPETTTS